jgi:hypothetical protein
MAKDEGTVTARYIACNVSTQSMLKTLSEIIAAMVHARRRLLDSCR